MKKIITLQALPARLGLLYSESQSEHLEKPWGQQRIRTCYQCCGPG